MLQEIKDLQNRAVTKLVEKIEEKRIVTFKSPTGSGKTYMMADLMDRIIEKDNEVVFLVSALSKGGLAAQNYEKFCEYIESGYFPNLKPYLINSEVSNEGSVFIPCEDYNVYILPTDLFRSKTRLMEGCLEAFLSDLTLSKYFSGKGKTVYLIRDESHRATNNIDELLDRYMTKKINISATPNTIVDVEITEEEALQYGLIKRMVIDSDENVPCEVAINKFEEIKESYRDLLGVNPCLVIQVSNSERGELEINEIKEVLNKVEHQDLRWMYIVNKESECEAHDDTARKLPKSEWKNYAKDKLSTIDIIIFKMVITEGFDIPRACMLYQSRESRSVILNEQVLGRVRRNPRLLDYELLSEDAKELATTAWVWGNAVNERAHSFNVKLCADGKEIQNEIKIKTTVLKTLENKKDFNLEEFIDSRKKDITSDSVFKLYKKIEKSDITVKDMCYEYAAEKLDKWFKFANNVDAINREYKNYICNYDESMEVSKDDRGNEKEISIPLFSSYIDNKNYVNIDNWIWNRRDGRDKFSFDSEAERSWASILQQIVNRYNNSIKQIVVGKINNNVEKTSFLEDLEKDKKYLWGKNYLQNSEIKYEYYLNGIHASFPDFIMKDSFDRIHLFEVKSVNVGNINIDDEQYKIKVKELENCYLVSSKLTQHIFYIPILKNDEWQIVRFKNGERDNLSYEQFLNSIITM